MSSLHVKTDVEAVIVGAGFSGIVTGHRLQKDLGLRNFLIYDRDERWGGTWSQNTYEGCGCDVPTRLYSLSFAQRANWDRFFSMQDEILAYTQEAAQQCNLDNKVRFGTEVVSAVFDEQNAHWTVKTVNVRTKEEKVVRSRLLFSCVGALSVPRKCDVPGADTFKGKLFHSARWQKDVALEDKNVVVLGNGCTASQIVPSIAPRVKQLTQIVRSKHWYLPHFGSIYDNAVIRWLQRNSSLWCSFERYSVVLLCESHFLQAFKNDGKGARQRVVARSRDYIERCAPKEYHDMLIPRPGEVEVACKRRIFDSTYIPCLGRPNVELTNDQAAEIVEDGLVLKSGRKVAADVIILANGFQTDQFALQMEIKNAKGQTLEEYWKNEVGAPQAYRTEMCSAFPNMFIIWGPNSITGHFSAIWSIERSVEMATRILRPLFLTGNPRLSPLARSHGKSIRVRRQAEDFEQEITQIQMKDMIFSTGCGSWYVDEATGRVTAVNPSFQTVVAWRSKFPYFDDFEYRGVSKRDAWRAWTWRTRIGSTLGLGKTPDLRPDVKRNIFVRLFRLPFWLLRYLLSRLGIRLLQMVAWLLDAFYPYNKPQPYSAKKV